MRMASKVTEEKATSQMVGEVENYDPSQGASFPMGYPPWDKSKKWWERTLRWEALTDSIRTQYQFDISVANIIGPKPLILDEVVCTVDSQAHIYIAKRVQNADQAAAAGDDAAGASSAWGEGDIEHVYSNDYDPVDDTDDDLNLAVRINLKSKHRYKGILTTVSKDPSFKKKFPFYFYNPKTNLISLGGYENAEDTKNTINVGPNFNIRMEELVSKYKQYKEFIKAARMNALMWTKNGTTGMKKQHIMFIVGAVINKLRKKASHTSSRSLLESKPLLEWGFVVSLAAQCLMSILPLENAFPKEWRKNRSFSMYYNQDWLSAADGHNPYENLAKLAFQDLEFTQRDLKAIYNMSVQKNLPLNPMLKAVVNSNVMVKSKMARKVFHL